MSKAGRKAPAFSLPDQDGNTVKLADFKGKTVVLYFYPKDMTSGCTQQACDFRDDLGRYKRAGAVVLGVSPDPVKSHRKFADKHDLPFTLLADEGAKVAQKYGVWAEKSMYGRKYMGIVRSTFLINPKGSIDRVWTKVKVNGHVQEVLEAVKGKS